MNKESSALYVGLRVAWVGNQSYRGTVISCEPDGGLCRVLWDADAPFAQVGPAYKAVGNRRISFEAGSTLIAASPLEQLAGAIEDEPLTGVDTARITE